MTRSWPLFGSLLLLASLFFATGESLAAQTFSVESVPNPRREDGGSVIDAAGLLGGSEAVLEGKVRAVEKATSVEIAIVILPSIGDEVPKAFASALFARFGIGDARTNRGLLVLHVVDARRVEIETGYGLEGDLPDVKCSWILRDLVLPSFKEGKFVEGYLGMIDALGYGLSDPKAGRTSLIARVRSGSPELLVSAEVKSEEPFTPPLWFDWASVVAIFGLGFLRNREQKILYPKQNRDSDTWGVGPFVAVFWGGAALTGFFARIPWVTHLGTGAVLFGGYFVFREFWTTRKKARARFSARTCGACGKKMTLVENGKDQKFLPEPELAEERLRAFDYDVWRCTCGAQLVVQNEGSEPRERCPSCNRHTIVIKRQKLRPADESSEGEELVVRTCKRCKNVTKTKVAIPRIKPASTSSGGSSASSDSSWSSSSSSSGDFGGGSSGGGGAGGSY